MSDRVPLRRPRLPRRLGLAAALMAAAAPALAQGVIVSYPASRSLADVGAWLQRDTPLQLPQVIDVSPSAVTAVLAAAPTGAPRGFVAQISSEAVDPQIASREGIASWSIPVDVDCDRRMVRLGPMTGYRSRDLATDPKVVREADVTWVSPTASAPLGAVVRALCDRDYHRPFAGKTKLAAAKPPPETGRATRNPAAPTQAQAQAQADAPALRPTLAPAPSSAPSPAIAKAAPAPKAEPAPSAPLKGGGTIAVQIGASPSRPDIEALLAKFKKAHAAELTNLTPNVATAQVDGKTVNRALISGFATNAEANAFCKALEASGQACFIRR
ncbi:SPOR domain-containing protein [Phenylobacterium sp.]|uniref:SPOR domain-containing protein n=1 Tax=Phenylobacterium sp. TaxID=1871053 RepID=UPI0025E9859A|nr:SPOR domain-containing protein [Phenylobacterium sp.]